MRGNFVGEVFTEPQTRPVDADPVNHAVGTGKVNELKGAGIKHRVLRALRAGKFAVLADKDRFTRGHIAFKLKFQAHHRHGLGAHEVILAAVGVYVRTEAKRPDAVRITECQKALAGNQGDDRVRALHPAVHALDGFKGGFRRKLLTGFDGLGEFVGKDV